MKASEIRIGNLVGYRFNRKVLYVPVLAIQQIGNEKELRLLVELPNGSTSNSVSFFKPIPLTEDWLSRFGFIKSEDYDSRPGWYAPGRLPIYLTKENEVWSENGYNITIKYVHQLQNLVHVLTGQELTIKQTA